MRVWTNEQIQEHRAAYLAALRSGEYKQGKSWLTVIIEDDSSEENCCLGVACEVAMRDGVVRRSLEPPERGRIYVTYVSTEDPDDLGSRVLPNAVQDWLGVKDPDPRLPLGNAASDLNDNIGWSFAQIANKFEEFFQMER